MTPKVEHWRYPFTSAHKHPIDHMAAMAKANGGYYPIGGSGIWHGGVHFDSGTAGAYEQDAVQCIANGEVVAYRIDSRYPKTAYPPKLASFSTGFVLVRHRLEVPPPKFSTVSGPSLTFFSLYMHLRDWAGYEANDALNCPAFWEGVTEYEVATESSGLSVRAQPGAEAAKLAELPKGAVVTVGAVEGEYRELLALVSGTPSEPLPANADSPRLGWVASRFLSPHGKPTPHSKDAVVVLPQPVRINAGDLIGHVGVYQQPIQDRPEPVLHLEIFSCEDVPAFMAQCRLTGFRLADEHMTLLKVCKGDRLIPHKASINADNPPDRFAPDAVKIGADFMLPQSYLDHLPATHKITVTLAPATRNTPAQEIHWLRLENLLPDEQGNLISGWFLEQDLVTTRHSPWEWENFECIREIGTAVEQHAYAFNAKGLLTADEQQNFRAQINKADEGPIVAFTRLHKMIDTDGDNVLSSNEIQAALGKPWQAQVLAQLVTHYESEWFWSSKWDEMDSLMGQTPVKSNPNWEASKKRIQTLSWWADVTSVPGISADGKAWHFHPMGMIGSFTKREDENDLKWLIVEKGQLTFDVEGNDIEDPSKSGHRFFSRKIHWPGGASGVTIGRGYDLGQRPNPRDDLTAVGIKEPLLSWLIGAKGLKGQTAKDYMDSASQQIKIAVITRKQQHDLFTPVYEFMKSEVIRISSNTEVSRRYGALDWDATDEKIKDVTIDLIYRGDYTSGTRATIQSSITENDITRFSEIIRDRSNWTTVPPDRFNKRHQYLEN